MKFAACPDWSPCATLDILRRRARLLDDIRAFFRARGVLEVETPALSTAATTDPRLASFTVAGGERGAPPFYLHTSPEHPMKRLLAAGSGPIYQICKVFRDGESGRLHNPEFTLIEWYRPGFTRHALMEEVAQLIWTALAECNCPRMIERLSYREAFERYAGINPLTASGPALAARSADLGIAAPPTLADDDLDGWRDLILSHAVEPRLGRGGLTLLDDYPASQAALARIHPGDPPVAERFEVYLEGIELANGFHELDDPAEQRARFERDLDLRRRQGLPTVPADERLLAALAHGLPDCSGVALGFDRLVMLAVGATSVQDVLPFPIERA